MTFDRILNYIDSLLSDYFDLAIPDISIIDILEILIIAIFIFQVGKFLMRTRAWTLLKGILFIAIFFILAAVFQMKTILWLGERFISVAFVAIVIVFQPELRHALEHIGSSKFLSDLIPAALRRNQDNRFSDKTLKALISSAFAMGQVKTGALIVIEKNVDLSEFVHTGIDIDSIVSKQLIINIFEKNTPLHDGAIIIKGDRIVAATCYLPLSANPDIQKSFGTRHRAALGVSEVTDSLTIVVSEETGHITVAEGGKLSTNLNEEELREILVALQKPEIITEGGEDAQEAN